MSSEDFTTAYAPDRIGRPWGYRSTDYATGAHRGQDIRQTDPTGSYSIPTSVVAISDGTVDYIGRPSTALGPTIRIRRDGGGYEFHSHTIATVPTGTHTTAGTVLGRNAHLDENPGQIDGVHDHIVFSDYSDGAWNTVRPTLDPYPIITRRLKEIDMPLNPDTDYDAFAYMLHRALKWDVRDGDRVGADAKNGRTIWDRFGQIDATTAAIDRGKPDATAAVIDYDKLAAALAKQGIAASVADELAQRLKS